MHPKNPKRVASTKADLVVYWQSQWDRFVYIVSINAVITVML
jgi:hypothetical protein